MWSPVRLRDDLGTVEWRAPDVVAYLRTFGFRVDAYRPAGARIDGLDRVSPTDARQLRLRHARRLERDASELGGVDRPLAPA